ncbi:MAG TPA: histidine kinase [Bacteroidales bacterium]|nr:histidine kinase [Bacteroidales bacterium]
MKQRNSHTILSFKKLFWLLVGLSAGIQVIVIAYNHLSGYHTLAGWEYFALRMIRGIALSLPAAIILAYADLFMIGNLNRWSPWERNSLRRIPVQVFYTILVALVVAILFTSVANWLRQYDEDLKGVYVNNMLIFSAVNVLLMSILEAWIYFAEGKQARSRAEHLEKELSQVRFEVLKSQINPHFMFNSLNVLSGLISTDVTKAQLFIDEFSHIYRYVLETIEQPVVTLGKELDFMRSYLFLQQIRYGEDLSWNVDIPAGMMQMVLPPLSLQVLLENAIKHNVVNKSKPLGIDITTEGSRLVVRNNIQPKAAGTSTGLGLKNLVKRYAAISREEPEFKVVNNHYIAKIPLIPVE